VDRGSFGRVPACGLGFSASFASGTLTINFNLGLDRPSLFSIVLLNSSGPVGTLFSHGIPAVTPLKTFTLTQSPFPNLGTITVRPELESGPNQMICAEWTTVNTAQ
jgi:hypothetical protein